MNHSGYGGDTPWQVSVMDGSGFPWVPAATIETVLAGGRLPYHPIFSRGMLQRWMMAGWATTQEELGPEASWWHGCAPLLEDAWNFFAGQPGIWAENNQIDLAQIQERFQWAARQLFNYLVAARAPLAQLRPYTSIPPDVSAGMIDAAFETQMCSFDQGLSAALDHLISEDSAALLDYCECASGNRPVFSEIDKVEMSALKEGHTSTVIRVAVWPKGGRKPILFGLNVARDLSGAAEELRVNASNLKSWSRLISENVADVYRVGQGSFRWFDRVMSVPIMAVQWFEAARELHVMRDTETPEHSSFLLVDEFQGSAQPLPGIKGLILEEGTSDQVWADIIKLQTCLASIDWETGNVEAPELELNHGDVVAEMQGPHIHLSIVASSAQGWQGNIGAWPYQMALISARDDESPTQRRIYWGKPAAALQALYEGLLERQPHNKEGMHRLVISMLQSALTIDLGVVKSDLLLPSDIVGPILISEMRSTIVAYLTELGALENDVASGRVQNDNAGF